MSDHMNDHFIFKTHRAQCHHCKQITKHVIKAVPYKAQVSCDNCGVTRVFVPRLEDLSKPGTLTHLGDHDIWELVSDAHCRNCNVHSSHDVVVGHRHLTVQCWNCGFTHFYKIDIEFIAKDELKSQ
ncbi:MAG: hypothetical protein ABR887_06110 [Methanoregulaceae archaeon]|jgi:uncharacterized Zn finger protein